LQRRGGAARRTRGLLAFGGRASVARQGAFLVEQALPTRVHQGHDLGQVIGAHAQVNPHGTGVAMSLAGILAIQNRRDAFGQAGIENFLDFRDASRNAGDNFGVSQFLEGFVFCHARILNHLGAQI